MCKFICYKIFKIKLETFTQIKFELFISTVSKNHDNASVHIQMIGHIFRVTNRHSFDINVFRGQPDCTHQSKEIGIQSLMAAVLRLVWNIGQEKYCENLKSNFEVFFTIIFNNIKYINK